MSSEQVAPKPARGNGLGGLVADGRFRRVWLTGWICGSIRWMELLAIGVYVYDRTGSATAVAAMTIARQAPMALFGVIVGTLLEGVDRRRVLLAILGLLCLMSLGLGVLAWLDVLPIWAIACAAFVSGAYFATDLPLRRTMLGDIAGVERIGPAMSLDSASNNATRMMGPAIGGLAYQTVGLGGAYFVSALLYLCAILLILPIDYRGLGQAVVARTQGVFAATLEGLAYVRTDRALLATLAITVTANLFGFPYAAMVPVVGRDVLQLDASLIGLLMSGEGLGALLGALLIAALARPPQYQTIYRVGTALFLAGVLVFAFSAQFWLSLPVLFVAGFGVAGFSAMQSTIVFRTAPPAMRSRVMGMLAMCIGAGPIGLLHVGLLADWLGAPTAVAVIAVEGLLALAAVCLLFAPRRR